MSSNDPTQYGAVNEWARRHQELVEMSLRKTISLPVVRDDRAIQRVERLSEAWWAGDLERARRLRQDAASEEEIQVASFWSRRRLRRERSAALARAVEIEEDVAKERQRLEQAVLDEMDAYRERAQTAVQTEVDGRAGLVDRLRAIGVAIASCPVAFDAVLKAQRSLLDGPRKDAEKYLKNLEGFIKADLPAVKARLACMVAASRILESTSVLKSNPLDARISTTYAEYAEEALRRLDKEMAAAADRSYRELLTGFRDPARLADPMSWLVLWNAMAASAGSAKKLMRTTLSENERAALWAAEWRSSAKAWTDEVLAGVGLNPGLFDTAVAHVASTGAEAKTGADVLVLLWHRANGVDRCRVVNVQFKSLNGESKFSVKRHGWRQFDKLAKMHDGSDGRIGALYGLLGNDGSPDTSASSVPLERVSAALGRALAEAERVPPAAGSLAKENYSVDWKLHGEPLAIGLTLALCDLRLPAWQTPSEALDDIQAISGAKLADYLIVQAFGRDAASLWHEVAQFKALLQSRGIELDFDVDGDQVRMLKAAEEQREHLRSRSVPSPDRSW